MDPPGAAASAAYAYAVKKKTERGAEIGSKVSITRDLAARRKLLW